MPRFFIPSRLAGPTRRVATVPSQVIRGAALAPAVNLRIVTTDDEYAGGPVRVLLPPLSIYVLGIVPPQGFNLVYLRVAQGTDAGGASGLITAISGIVLGVAYFLYGTLDDFILLRRIVDVGIALIVAGSLLGFIFSSPLVGIIVARALQTLGYQVTAPAYMTLATATRDPKKRSLCVGLMCTAFQGGTAIGTLADGILADINWALLFLIPLAGLTCLPIMGRRAPVRVRAECVDVVNLAIFSSPVLLLTLVAVNPCWWLIAGLILGGVLFWRYIGRARAPFVTRSFFTNVPWTRSISLIVIVYRMNFTVAPLMNGTGAANCGLTPVQASVCLLPAYCVAPTTTMMSGTVMVRIGHGRTVCTCVILILVGTALTALHMSMGPWMITIAMRFIYAGFGALLTPIHDTVFTTIVPGQGGRAVTMNDLAMQGSAAIGIGAFTPTPTTGAFRVAALVCVVVTATGIAGDWLHKYLYRRGR